MKASSAFILAAAVGIAGCKRIASRDVEGDWTIKDSSRAVLPDQMRSARSEIRLQPDGTFVATSVPDLLADPAHPQRFDSGHGRWTLIARQGRQQVQLTFDAISDWHGPLPYGTQLGVSRGELFYFVGDPDEGRVVSFHKRK